jgi:DNA-binding response OmpR family regulator
MATILIADDEPHIRDLVRLILDKHTIIAAEDGSQALALAIEKKPDLVILDVMMPKLNGYEVLERLRKDAATRQLKIAMLSAKVQEEDQRMAKDRGADYYITKPFDPLQFEQRVEEMLVR